MLRLASSFALALAVSACGPRPTIVTRTPTPAVVVVPTELANGRVEIALRPRYALGTPTRVDVTIVVTRGRISGPTDARVMAGGAIERGAPAEVLVRRLGATAVIVTAGRRATTSVTWNGDDEFGMRVPADAYVLLLDFETEDEGTARTVRASATLQMTD